MVSALEEDIIATLKKTFEPKVKDASVKGTRRISVLTEAGSHKAIISFLKETYGPIHLSAITATDMGDEGFEISFNIWSYDKKTYILVKSKIPKDAPVIDSIVDIIPGATLYEREAHDLLGIVFRGHPNLTRLILPEDWPEGVYPLRKDWKPPEIR